MLPIESNRWWMFWGIVVAVFALIMFNLTGIPFSVAGSSESDIAREAIMNDSSLTDQERQAMIDPNAAIEYTKTTVCRQHANLINMMVELWYVNHGGVWPNPDLSDIGRDKDYFPNGVPICPYNGMPYALDPTTHRVELNFYEVDDGKIEETIESMR
ncbi:MAG TPA: hypothetical protein PLK80_03800 [bacterium]|nr:hypothetical protein [bacterium]HPI75833.1 hypothetical protein [bacterium]